MKYNIDQNVGNSEELRLEIVTTCVGFDDILDVTLNLNHAQADHYIVVTSHEDTKTQKVARKYGATLVLSDLFKKNGRNFNKGAAINQGMGHFQYHGWRLCLDSDIVLPDNFRRVLFNHTHLDKNNLYGADRIDVIGKDNINKLIYSLEHQHTHGVFVQGGSIGTRYVDNLYGYCPLGFFQLFNAKTQKNYPYSLGTAAHDDILFAASYPLANRVCLPSVICYHLCPSEPFMSQNWDGNRRIARLK